jgi:general secretion pathway protein I
MKNKAAGFTLIEVLIALVIISIAMTAVIKATSQNIRDTLYLQNKMIAHWVGLNTVNGIRAGVIKLSVQADNIEETSQMLGEKWAWKAALLPTPNKSIWKIKVTVSHEPDQRLYADLTSYMYVAP